MSKLSLVGSKDPSNIFQFDVEQPDLDGYNNWLSSAFDKFLGVPYDPESMTYEELFHSGRFFQLDCQVWLEPGYYIPFVITVDFAYITDRMSKGRYVAPCEIIARTNFHYPIDVEHNFISALRANPGYFLYQQLTTVTMNIIAQAGSILINSVQLL